MQASDQRKGWLTKTARARARTHARTHGQRDPQLLWGHLSRRERGAMAGNSRTSFISASESRVHTDIAGLHLVFFVLLHARTHTHLHTQTYLVSLRISCMHHETTDTWRSHTTICISKCMACTHYVCTWLQRDSHSEDPASQARAS